MMAQGRKLERKTETAARGARGAQALLPIDGPELVFGLVGPVGTNLSLLADTLREELASFGYEADVVRLSDLLREIPKYRNLPTTPADVRWDKHMGAGTDFRKRLKRGDALALLAISQIRALRKKTSGSDEYSALKNHAFILHSLKHPAEIETLRKIYGGAFYLLAAYSSRPDRINRISERIAQTRNDSDKTKYRDRAEALVRRDEEELETKLGQDVKDAFPLGDFFLRCERHDEIRAQLSRFLEAVFGYPFHTPEKDEFGMFCAKSAALRSADLGRQVGAAITSSDGDVISLACNEVPKAGGGQYWPGDRDYRDFQLGYDTNARVRKELISEIIDRLQEAKAFRTKRRTKLNVASLVNNVLTGGKKPLLQGARIMNLLEFGRTVHAEMAALADASRRGVGVAGATLYTTTFPCHLCARHIVAAGIKRLVYIEPYPKSMATDLYPDSIAVDESPSQNDCVPFEPFTGIAPRRYLELFEYEARKETDGSIRKWSRATAKPRIKRFVTTYLILEMQAVKLLARLTKQRGLRRNAAAT